MKLTLALKIAKDCNVDTLGDGIKVIKENKEMLFEDQDYTKEMSELIGDVNKNGFKLSDCIHKCIWKYENKRRDNKWYDRVA